MTCGEWFALFTLIITVAGFCSGVYELNKNRKINRAKFIKELIDRIRDDNEIREFIYFIDDDDDKKDWYMDNSFYNNIKKTPYEKQVDKVLTYFSYLCYLKENKLINDDEFVFFDYEIRTLFNDNSTITYLHNLYAYANKNNRQCPFKFLIEYGVKTNQIDDDFDNWQESKRYKQVL